MTISRIGSDRAFTVIEVLVAATILSVGIIGVIGAYMTLMNGISTSSFTIEASSLLEEKMADAQRESIENLGLPAGTKNGVFGESAPGFRWEEETGEAKAAISAPEEASGEVKNTLKESLDLVRLSVITGDPKYSKRLSAYTYFENYAE